jgi:PadR family transcriptional regulator, regulatory protein AphA
LSTVRLTPFSYTVLVLVGRGGAGPHDLRRMAEIGRVYWDAAPSQWYAEPKRLAAHGYLEAHKTPGRTRERTHYELTGKGREALAEWVRTPATLPRVQNEPVVRLLAADLVDPAAVLEGLEAMRPDLEDALEGIARGQARAADIAHRAHLLEVNHRYAERLLALQQEWLAEAEAVLRAAEEPPGAPRGR